MLVGEVLRGKGSNVLTVGPDETCRAAATRFRAHQIGALVVTDRDDGVLGLVTERDLVAGLVATEARLLDRPVREFMTTKVPTCRLQDPVVTVMRTMTDRRTRHLPVVEKGTLRGIISIGDVVKARLEDLELENRVLRDIARAHH